MGGWIHDVVAACINVSILHNVVGDKFCQLNLGVRIERQDLVHGQRNFPRFALAILGGNLDD